tara:strand:- start:8243 stop:8464 length:222 start_codon:yes stop_codon:yes gene_type:complete
MKMYGIGKMLTDREITVTALAQELGVNRQKIQYWLDNNADVYAHVDEKSGIVTKITASPKTKVLYERTEEEVK